MNVATVFFTWGGVMAEGARVPVIDLRHFVGGGCDAVDDFVARVTKCFEQGPVAQVVMGDADDESFFVVDPRATAARVLAKAGTPNYKGPQLVLHGGRISLEIDDADFRLATTDLLIEALTSA